MIRSRGLFPLLLLLWITAPALAAEHPSLAQARARYNAGDFDGAIQAAALSRVVPAAADASALVTARAYLERYRAGEAPDDLAEARRAFASVRAAALTPRDQLDLLVGLGQALYLGESFGAAAELFETGLVRADILPARDRLLLLDWWATALDREALTRPVEERASLFERITRRMRDELGRAPGSGPANYWLAAAARGAGDAEGAWDAAVAGWIRATLAPESSATLRADLDRLVTQALIPERVGQGAPSAPSGPDPLEADRDEPAGWPSAWARVKAQWP